MHEIWFHWVICMLEVIKNQPSRDEKSRRVCNNVSLNEDVVGVASVTFEYSNAYLYEKCFSRLATQLGKTEQLQY